MPSRIVQPHPPREFSQPLLIGLDVAPLVVLAASLVLLSCAISFAQIPASVGVYRQDFDSLATTGTSNPWTDNSTLPGWYASKTSGGAAISGYRADSGGGNAGALYSFGSSGSPDRALGSIASGTPGSLIYGVRFANDTAQPLTNINVSYTGEQWRNGGTGNPQALTFSYQISGGPITDNQSGVWIPFAGLNFVSPNLNTTSGALDGNAAANRLLIANVALAGAVVQPGEELFFRWTDVDDASFDNGLAIDDLTVAFNGASPPPPAEVSTNVLSLLQYNVKGNGTTDWSTNTAQVQAIGRQLLYLKPDIITFNEIPLTNTWEMANWVKAFLPGYTLATNSGTDSFIRSVIASRHPITRSTKWLDGVDLKVFGYTNENANLDNFTRDLFEAEIAVPGFPRPLHVFTTHLKASTGDYADASAKRAAEAAAITNFFATNLFVHFPFDPYVLAGDLNDSETNVLAIQRLVGATSGLHLTSPRNPVTGSVNTFSTATANPSSRLDYILPCGLLATNIAGSEVFRTDRLTPLPPGLFGDDSKVASDHYPVLTVFFNPYAKPFRVVNFEQNSQSVSLSWESVFGQPYNVETSSNLTAWTALATNLVATNGNVTWVTNYVGGAQFYRVRRVE